MRRNVQSVLFGNKTCDNFFNHFFYSLIILRSSLRCILEKWYRLVSFDHATFPHQEERTVEENCEQPDGRYRYVQKNLDEGYARKILCWSSSAIRKVWTTWSRHLSRCYPPFSMCMYGTPYWIYQRLCRGLFKVVAFNTRNQPEMKNWQDNRR